MEIRESSCLRRISITTGLTAILALSTCFTASAVDVFTDPVGFITLNITGPATSQYSFLGLGMTQLVTNRGIIASVSGTSITVSNGALTVSQFAANVNGPGYFIEIVSGANSGVQDDIVDNTATTITTKDDLSALGLAGQTYKVYPHWTLASVFGPNDESGLRGANSAAAADQVLLNNPLTQATPSYYFRTNNPTVTATCPLGGCGWRTTASTSSNVANTVLYIEQGILVKRLNDPGTNLLLVGAVKLSNTVTVIIGSNIVTGANSYNLLGNVYPVTNATLGASGLYTGNSSTGVLGANSAAAADQVLISDGLGGFSTYYFRTNVPTVTAACPLGLCGWRSTASTSVDQSGVGLPMGGSFFLLRRPGTNFQWTATQPFTQ